jgi:hypothetical protein
MLSKHVFKKHMWRKSVKEHCIILLDVPYGEKLEVKSDKMLRLCKRDLPQSSAGRRPGLQDIHRNNNQPYDSPTNHTPSNVSERKRAY